MRISRLLQVLQGSCVECTPEHQSHTMHIRHAAHKCAWWKGIDMVIRPLLGVATLPAFYFQIVVVIVYIRVWGTETKVYATSSQKVSRKTPEHLSFRLYFQLAQFSPEGYYCPKDASYPSLLDCAFLPTFNETHLTDEYMYWRIRTVPLIWRYSQTVIVTYKLFQL